MIDSHNQSGEGKYLVRLTILSSVIDPHDLTSLLGVEPDDSWEAGTNRVWRGRSLPIEQPYNGIRYVSSLSEDAAPSDHIRDIFGRLGDAVSKLRALSDHDDVERCRL